MKISVRKCVACILVAILVSLPLKSSIKAAVYLDRSVIEAGENHCVYLCPEDTDGIIVNWHLELFAALNLQGKWALYDFYGTQLTDYIYDGFYDSFYVKFDKDFRGSSKFTDENIKSYIGNEIYILTRDRYAILSTSADESESHNTDHPESTTSADVTGQALSYLFDNITPSEEMPFTAAYALKNFVLVEKEDIDNTFIYGILSYDGDIVLPMKYKLNGYFLYILKYHLLLSYSSVSENLFIVFDSANQELADIPLIPVSADELHYGYAGKDGLTVPCKYTEASYFYDGLASVAINRVFLGGHQGNFYEPPESDRMRGYIDTSGNIALEFFTHEVSGLSGFSDGLALITASASPGNSNHESFSYASSNFFSYFFYIDKTGRVVINQPVGDQRDIWNTATGFKNGIAIVANRMDIAHGRGVWVIRHTEGKPVEETNFLPRSEYLVKYAGYPDEENIMNVIGMGIYKGQEVLSVSDFPPNDERLFFRLAY